jgi:hypothetical protein
MAGFDLNPVSQNLNVLQYQTPQTYNGFLFTWFNGALAK